MLDKRISLVKNIPNGRYIKKYGERMAPHLHIPLQSGSNKILKKMGRSYSGRFFRKVIKKIRSKLPGITLTTDIMVGFPGETAEDFEKYLKEGSGFAFMKKHLLDKGTS